MVPIERSDDPYASEEFAAKHHAYYEQFREVLLDSLSEEW